MKRFAAVLLAVLFVLSAPFSRMQSYAIDEKPASVQEGITDGDTNVPGTEKTAGTESISGAGDTSGTGGTFGEGGDSGKENGSGTGSPSGEETVPGGNPSEENDGNADVTGGNEETVTEEDEETELTDALDAGAEMITEEATFEEHVIDDADLPDPDQLFAGYVQSVMYEGIEEKIPETEEDLISMPALNSLVPQREGLSANEKKLYDLLKTEVTKVANGERADASFSFSPASIVGKTTFTAAELGLADCRDGDAVGAALHTLFGDFRKVVRALMIDCPYELYWFDKTKGWSSSISDEGWSYGGYSATLAGNTLIEMHVAKAYSQADAVGTMDVDTVKTGAAKTARTNAEAIVTRHASKTDYGKLTAYRDEICAAVEYNHGALASGTPYGDPWQLIYVFDNDPTTDVVCEGYSKAFQLLYDLSEFQSNLTNCISVSGVMRGGTGAGGHMWNVLTMEDGENYIADVTNSDAGTRGNFRLFMRGAPDGTAETYTIGGVSYTYYKGETGHDNILEMYTPEQRVLSKNDSYTPPSYKYDLRFIGTINDQDSRNTFKLAEISESEFKQYHIVFEDRSEYPQAFDVRNRLELARVFGLSDDEYNTLSADCVHYEVLKKDAGGNFVAVSDAESPLITEPALDGDKELCINIKKKETRTDGPFWFRITFDYPEHIYDGNNELLYELENDPTVYCDTKEEAYAAIRNIIRNRTNNMDRYAGTSNYRNYDTDGYVYERIYVNSEAFKTATGTLTAINMEDVCDFAAEREGMAPYEGDYMFNLIGNRVKEAFTYEAPSPFGKDDETMGICTKHDPVTNTYSTYDIFEVYLPVITTLAEEQAVDTKVQSLLNNEFASVNNNSTDNITKINAIYNFITSHVSGTVSGGGGSNRKWPQYHTAYHALINGNGTCESFAQLFTRLSREMGVASKVIMGQDASAHTYNIVDGGDGYWYFIDCSAGIGLSASGSFPRAKEQERYTRPRYIVNYWNKIKGGTNYHVDTISVLDQDGTECFAALNEDEVTECLLDKLAKDPSATFTIRFNSNWMLDLYQGWRFGEDASRVEIDLNSYKLICRNQTVFGVKEIRNGTIQSGYQDKIMSYSGSLMFEGNVRIKDVSFTKGTGRDFVIFDLNEFYGAPEFVLENVTFNNLYVNMIHSELLAADPQYAPASATYRVTLKNTVTLNGCYFNLMDHSVAGHPVIHLEKTSAGEGGTVSLAKLVFKGTNTVGSVMWPKESSPSLLYDVCKPIEFVPVSGGTETVFAIHDVIATNNGTLKKVTTTGGKTAGATLTGITDVAQTLGHKAAGDDYLNLQISGKDLKFTKPSLQVTFNANGGKLVKSSDAKKTVIVGEPYGTLPVPVLTGYEFKGWFTAEKGGTMMTAEMKVPTSQTHTLYAQWEIETYRVSLDVKGGTATPQTDYLEITFGEAYKRIPTQVERDGYIFLGWYTSENGGTEVENGMNLVVNEDHTLYAVWKKEYPVAEPTAAYTDRDDENKIKKAEPEVLTEVLPDTKVMLTSATYGAAIYYTLDGSEPARETGTLYDDAIVLSEDWNNPGREVTIRAVAYKDGYKTSDPVSFNWKLKDQSGIFGTIKAEDKEREGFVTRQNVPEGLWVTGIEPLYYNGTAQVQPAMHVYHHTTLLEEKKDYTVKYTNNKNAGTAKVTITGKGAYKGTIKEEFEILKINLNEPGEGVTVTAPDIKLTYNGKVQKGTTTVTCVVNGRTFTLKAGTDFTYFYPHTNSKIKEGENEYKSGWFKDVRTDPDNPYVITITGKGKNFTGTMEINQWITNAKQVSKLTIEKIADQPYNFEGEHRVEPEIVVKDGETELRKGTDYEVSYTNNTQIGTATVTITGKENVDEGTGYIGTKTANFKIKGTPMGKVTVGGLQKSYDYTGADVNPVVSLINTERGTLTEGTDYTVSYTNRHKAGTVKVSYKGMGGYSGILTKSFTLKAFNLAEDAKEPSPQIQVYWQTDESKAWDAAGSNDPSYNYVKGGVKPEPVVKLTDGGSTVIRVLEKGKDYSLTYANNNQVGNRNSQNSKKKSIPPTVTIKGINLFTGSISRTFTIGERLFTMEGTEPLSITATDVVYQNKGGICKPVITIKDTNGAKLVAGTDYYSTTDKDKDAQEKLIKFTYVYDTMVDVKSGKTKELRTGESAPGAGDGNVVRTTDIIPAGTIIRVTVTGKGNYSSEITREGVTTATTISTTFRYIAGNVSKASVSVKAQNYEGVPVEPTKADITVKIGKTALAKTDYEIIGYTNNLSKRTGTVTIRGIGNYSGTKTVSFKINAKSMNYTVKYCDNRESLWKKLGMSEEQFWRRFKVTGTMADSVIAKGAKLRKNSFKIYDRILGVYLTFNGWNTEPDGDATGTTFTNQQEFDTPYHYVDTVELYAQWAVKKEDTYLSAIRELPGLINDRAASWDKIVCYGDSLTAWPGSYADKKGSVLGITTVNKAVGGAHINYDYSESAYESRVRRIVRTTTGDEAAGADAVFLMAGTVDWLSKLPEFADRPIGDVSTGETFKFDFDQICDAIEEKFPDIDKKQIYIVLPPPSAASGNRDLSVFRNAEREVAEAHGFTVIDDHIKALSTSSGAINKTYYGDSVHLNAFGYDVLAVITAEAALRAIEPTTPPVP